MALDFLFQGNPPPNITTSSTSSTTMPGWYEDYTKGLIARANVIGGEPYQPYGAPRIAGFTGDQNQAFDLTRSNIGGWQPFMDAAATATNRGAAPWSAGDRSQFLSPYLGGVVDEIGRVGTQNLMDNVLPRVQSEFVGAGQHGSTRYLDAQNRAIRDATREITGQQSLALQRGYDAAGTEYGQWADRALTGGQRLGALATLDQQLGMTDAAALESVGAQQQALNQRNLDTGYSDFIEQRDWPKNTANWMSSMIRGFQPPTTTTQVNNGPANVYGPSPLAQLASVYGIGRGTGLFRRGGLARIGRRPGWHSTR